MIRNPVDKTAGQWRLSAPEIEIVVRSATGRILDDHPAIGALLHDAGFSAQELLRALKLIDEYRVRLESEKDYSLTPAPEIIRVDLKTDGLQIALDLASLLRNQFELRVGAPLTITRFVPMRLKQRGVELRIVIAGERRSSPVVDSALIKAIARGHRWFNELALNRAKDTLEIAKREGLRDSYVRRLIPYAFLAPSIVEAISQGRQPADLTTERLTRRRLPHLWIEQRRAFGMDAADLGNR